VILGGGYIGLELAAVAQKRGLNVIVLERAERILQRVAAEQTSRYIRETHQQHGVQILEQSGVAQFHHQDGRLIAVTLESGQYIELDLMVVGIGVTANYEIAEACGIHIQNRAIWVNQSCETNLADIYAIGDCTCFNLDEQYTRLESVQNANEQADVVAARINQLEAKYQPVPWFWSDQYHLKLQISGLGRDYNHVYSRVDAEKGSASFWYFADNTLKAVDAINDPRAFMFSKKFLGKTLKDPAQLMDLNVELKAILV
jgi:3-phenylpropionate/trans-cinnamate dioxygenase ferredoxin reductase component